MATINYKTKEKPKVQKALLKALDWMGPRQTSYAELAKQTKCSSSDCRYAILDLIEKNYITRIQTKGYANATRGFRYAYALTDEGRVWMDEPYVEPTVEPEPEPAVPGLFE